MIESRKYKKEVDGEIVKIEKRYYFSIPRVDILLYKKKVL